MGKQNVQYIVDLMSEDCFYQLRSAADRGIIIFDDLKNYRLPDGYTPEDIWLILTSVRKQAAIYVPEDDYRTADCWFVTTSALSFDSKMLEVRCSKGFPLDEALNSFIGSPLVTNYLERTLSLAFKAEGIAVTDKRIHEIFSGAPIQLDLDRIISNYFEISRDSDTLAHRDVTHGLLETIYYRLIEGVDIERIPRRQGELDSDPRITPPTQSACLDAVCRRAQLYDDDEFRFGPVLQILNVSWFFWSYEVFPRLNSLVGILLRNIMAIKWGYPVLSWIPVGAQPFDNPHSARAKAITDSWMTDFGFGFDFTAYYSSYAKQYLAELDKIEASVAQLKRLDHLIEETFGAHLNVRQKSILSSLCKEPDSLLRIAPHQRTFRVAYATARNDFLELVKKGYLVKLQQGRAFVFQACPELRDRIVRLGEVSLEK